MKLKLLSAYTVITTGMIRSPLSAVLALNSLVNCTMFTPCCPSAGPTGGEEKVELDLEVGDAVVVTGGAWKDTTGLIQSINDTKQMVTINVELFGRETPVEISFAEVKKM